MSDRIVYNEHDYNQVQEILKKRKKQRRKKKMRRMMVVFVVLFIVGFFVSDFSRVQTVTITGNSKVTEEEISDASGIDVHSSWALLVNKSTVEANVTAVPFIKSVNVSKSLFGKVTIAVTETNIVAYQVVGEQLWIIDDSGEVIIKEDHEMLSLAQRSSRATNFTQEQFLAFSKEYVKIPSQVRNQVSDIIYSPETADENRCTFNMDDGKVLYVRIDDMAEQLKDDRYAAIIKQYPDDKYYDFVGKYCYIN